MWKIKTLPKIANFLWQACKDALPTLHNLCRRGINVDPICRLCGDEPETQNHIFLQCKVTQQAWMGSSIRIQATSDMGSFKNFLWSSMMRFPTEVMEQWVVVAWNIWITRNKAIFESIPWNLKDTLLRIQKTCKEIKDAQETKEKTNRQAVDNGESFSLNMLRAGWVRMEVDVAVISETKIGVGMVIRDREGHVLLAAKEEKDGAGSSTALEGLAIRWALTMCKERGYDQLIVVNDNVNVIQAINGQILPSEFEAHIITDIQEMASDGSRVQFVHMRINYTKAAHFMARGPVGIFCNQVPSHIVKFV